MNSLSEGKNDSFPGSGSLLSVLAHDLNNVLGGVTGAVSLIEFEKEDSPGLHNPAYDPYLDIIQKSSARASGLVQQLLVLTRQSTNKSEAILLAESLERIIASVKTACGSADLIILDPVPEKARIRGNSIRFEKLVLLLLLAACSKRQTEGGEIRLSVYPEGDLPGKSRWRLKFPGIGFSTDMLRELAGWYGPELDSRISTGGELDLGFSSVAENI